MAVPTWRGVRPNFSGSNQAMANAQRGVAAFTDGMGNIQDRIIAEQKHKDALAQQDLANKRVDAQQKLSNNRADAQLKIQQDKYKQEQDDRLATFNALTTNADLGRNVPLDAAQTRSQSALSNNISKLYAPTDKAFNEGFADTLKFAGVTEDDVSTKMLAGDEAAKDLYLAAQTEGNKRANSLATQAGIRDNLNEDLTANSHVQAMMTPTLEQEYIARKEYAMKSGSPAAIKAVDDAMLPAVQAERTANAAAAEAARKQRKADYDDQVALLKKATAGGEKGYTQSDLFKGITPVPEDASQYIKSDFNWDREGRAMKAAEALATIGVNSKDILPIIKSINPSEDSFLGYKFDDVNFDTLSSKYGSKVADIVKGYAEGTYTADDLVAMKKAKKSSGKGMSYSNALEELERLKTARDSFTTGSTDRLSASTDNLDKYFGGLTPTKQDIESKITGTPTVGTKTTSSDGTVKSVSNNNPGNIKISKDNWQGSAGDDGTFVTFEKPEDGVRAMTKDLSNKIAKGTDTIEKIITKWAPASDDNDTTAYIKNVSEMTGIDPSTPITSADMFPLVKAMTTMEGGHESLNTFTDEVIAKGVGEIYPEYKAASVNSSSVVPKVKTISGTNKVPTVNPYQSVRDQATTEYNRLAEDNTISPVNKALQQLGQRAKYGASAAGELVNAGLVGLDNAGTAIGNLFRVEQKPYMSIEQGNNMMANHESVIGSVIKNMAKSLTPESGKEVFEALSFGDPTPEQLQNRINSAGYRKTTLLESMTPTQRFALYKKLSEDKPEYRGIPEVKKEEINAALHKMLQTTQNRLDSY